jgi:lysophospholipase L1-like esterase
VRPQAIRRAVLLCGLALVVAACGESASSQSQSVVTVPAFELEAGTIEPLPDLEGISSVAMVGDSITFMSSRPLRAALEGLGLDVVAIDAQVGRRMTIGTRGQLYPGSDVIAFIAAEDGADMFVVALGTNDVGQYPDAQGIAEQVDAVLAAVPAGAPLVWVNTWHRDRDDEAELMNDVIGTIVGRRQRTVVVDWHAYGDDDGVITSDGVHPTPSGTETFALVVATGVRDLIESL